MRSFAKIKWPVYPLPRDCNLLHLEDGCVVIEMADESYRVVDDISMPGNTLAARRLQYKSKITRRELFKLNKPLYSIIDLLHYKGTNDKYIDCTGRIFSYKKSKRVPLTYHKVSKFLEFKEGYIVIVPEFHCRFFINRAPKLNEHYAGILRVGRGFLLYELCREYKKGGHKII